MHIMCVCVSLSLSIYIYTYIHTYTHMCISRPHPRRGAHAKTTILTAAALLRGDHLSNTHYFSNAGFLQTWRIM